MEDKELLPNDIHITFVLGAPGAGKGTLCKELVKQYNHYHLSVGDFLRAIVGGQENVDFAGDIISIAELKSYLDAHQLVPPKHIVYLMRLKITDQYVKGKKYFLIDGFPRDDLSAKMFSETVGVPKSIWIFNLPKAVARGRFIERARLPTDSVEVFEKRYAEFEESNKKVLGFLETMLQVEVIEIDTSGKTEESLEKLLEALGWRDPGIREDTAIAS